LSIKIERNVPPPPTAATLQEYPFTEMNVGDSFWVEDPNGRVQARIQAKLCYYKRTSGTNWTTRRIDGGVRVWRIK
jgi:hypothetical protein